MNFARYAVIYGLKFTLKIKLRSNIYELRSNNILRSNWNKLRSNTNIYNL